MSVFVAAGHQGQRVVSKDGAEWTGLQVGKEGEIYRGVAAGGGVIVAVGNFGGKNLFAVTKDGAAWTVTEKEAQYKFYIRGLAWGEPGFLGLGGDPGSVGSSAPFVTLSKDGATWSDYTPIPGKHILRRLAWGKGLFVGVGDRGRRAASKDGKEWTDTPNVKALDTLVDVAFGAGKFVGVGLHGLRMATEDGVAWPHRFPGEEGEHLNSILWAGDRFVAVGLGATYFSPDGLEWTRKENKDAPLTAVWGAGVFVGTNWRGRILRSTDAIEWKQVYKAEHHLEAVAYG
jgi:hypothetical protein